MASAVVGQHRLLAGALSAAVIAGAAGVAQAAAGSAAARGMLLFVIVAGFVFGGYVAARGQAARAAKLGALGAAGGFVLVQGIATLRRLVVDQPISLGAIVLGALTAAVCGSIGGLLAARQQQAPEP